MCEVITSDLAGSRFSIFSFTFYVCIQYSKKTISIVTGFT